MSKDELASIRTHLANERTLLAYVRTALAFLAAGAGMIHFLDSSMLQAVGWLIGASGLAVAIFGVVRFIAVKRHIAGTEGEKAGR